MPDEAKLCVSKFLTLPPNRVDKSFWTALNVFLAPALQPDFPLANPEFRRLPMTGRRMTEEPPTIDANIVAAANSLRHYYDAISLWNPLFLSNQLGVREEDVVKQFLLAKEYGLVSMHFVVLCRSCGCDVRRVSDLKDITFCSTFHRSNILFCPMCTDRTEVVDCSQVAVYFHEPVSPPLLRRRYHRLFCTDEVRRRCLESYFCPPGAAFAFHVRLPAGKYMFIASGAGLIVEIHVETGAEYLERDKPPKAVTLSFNKLMHATQEENEDEVEKEAEKREVINVEHGKLFFRVFNDTPYGGYLDLCIAFDERLEFLTLKQPVVANVPMVLHYTSRGLRSPLFRHFVPTPPGARTSGVYVIQSFTLAKEEFANPINTGTHSSLSVIREVHRYSLEDHKGFLISVSGGGSVFESSFLSLTAALASSLCFAQRIVTRLGEGIAANLVCCVTEGAMYMTSFQGQYDDDENVRSSYPDVQIVGPVIYAATHPPIQDGQLDGFEECNGNQEVEEHKPIECSEMSSVFGAGSVFRCELRSVSEEEQMGICLREDVEDSMLSYFLSFIKEHLKGAKIINEPQALVVEVPFATLNAMVMLPALLDSSTYTKPLSGPFG